MNIDLELEKKIARLFYEFKIKNYEYVILKAQELINKDQKFPIIYNLLGVAYSLTDNHYKATRAYDNALHLDPTNEEIYRNLAKSFFKLNEDDKAIEAFNKSIEIKANNADAIFGIGLVYLKKKKFKESIINFNLAINYNKNFFQAYYNLAIAQNYIGNLLESQNNYIEAIKINKNYYQALNNLGSILIRVKKVGEAIKVLEKALEIKPNYLEALINIGVAYLDVKKFDIALKSFNTVIEIDPDNVKAITQKIYLMRKICDWSEDNLLEQNLNLINESNIEVTPWQLLSLSDDPKKEHERAIKYGKQFRYQNIVKPTYQNSKIRIAYFTSDFYEHAGMMNMEGIFKYHDKNKFEIYGFDYGYSNSDKTHQRIKKYFDKFFYIQDLSDKEVVKIILENKIDIAIHRNGYSQNSRNSLFAKKIAPIQISFLGYPGTMGVKFIDYIIADKTVIPNENKQFFSEKIIYLPHTYYPTNNERSISKTIYKRADIGIDEEAFVFGSFNNSYKISSIEFSIWMSLLNKIDNSFLILLISDELTKKNLKKEILKHNQDLNRIKFLNFISIDEHLARHKLIDLYLDTFNYNGHTSSVDALYSGVPVLTKVGNSFTSSVCASILNAMQMNELIVSSKKEYFELAFEFATNKERFSKLKIDIKNKLETTALFNTKKYVQNLEKGYRIALSNKVNLNKVDHILV